jgi:hypothetical protein
LRPAIADRPRKITAILSKAAPADTTDSVNGTTVAVGKSVSICLIPTRWPADKYCEADTTRSGLVLRGEETPITGLECEPRFQGEIVVVREAQP